MRKIHLPSRFGFSAARVTLWSIVLTAILYPFSHYFIKGNASGQTFVGIDIATLANYLTVILPIVGLLGPWAIKIYGHLYGYLRPHPGLYALPNQSIKDLSNSFAAERS